MPIPCLEQTLAKPAQGGPIYECLGLNEGVLASTSPGPKLEEVRLELHISNDHRKMHFFIKSAHSLVPLHDTFKNINVE